MIKLIIGLLLLIPLVNYKGVCSYKNVETLSDLGSLLNCYLTIMLSVLLIAFGLDDIVFK